MVQCHTPGIHKEDAEMPRFKFFFAFAICLLVSTVWLARAAPLHAAESAAGKASKAVIKTKFGDMEIVFFPDKAPNHVQNFVKLAQSGYYNGTIFHRVIPGFMIQGGDPNTKDPKKPETYGMGGPTEKLKAEFNDTPHRRGIVSMARTNDPNSAGSQFFIVVKDSNFLDGQYTVFGEVVKGMEVADKIVSLPRNPRNDLPNERVEITVTVE
jgi:peptidyl-prolyl cis-trans isomerase B (cyclophilin B)